MNIGVFIPYNIMLAKYLPEVIKTVIYFDEILLHKSMFDDKQSEAEVRNKGLKMLKHCDYVITIDSDEIILIEDFHKALEKMDSNKYDSCFMPVIDYTPDLNHRYKRNSNHCPVVIVDPKKVEFYDGRCLRFSNPLFYKDGYIHHLGFTYKYAVMEWKKEHYWNNKNPNEFEQILENEIEPCKMPPTVGDMIGAKNSILTP